MASTASARSLSSPTRLMPGAATRLMRPPSFVPRNAKSSSGYGTMLSIAVRAMSIWPLRSMAICVVELGAGARSTFSPRAANKPFSWATKIGKFALPAKPMTRSVAGCACAAAAAANATMASQWAMKTAGYDTPMLRSLALLFFSVAAAAANRDVYMYQGADREARLIAGAKQEGQVVLYSTMTVQDGRALAAAFEKKYGVKLLHWRGSAEKIVQRALAEARSGHDGADVFETSSHRMEALYREKLLEDFYTPAFAELASSAFAPGHRQWVAARFAFFVLGYNTKLVKPAEVPSTYEDLLQPRWVGRLAIESTDVLWFAALTKAMGEEKGLAFFRRLAAMKPQIRSGHILGAQLVASGEIPLFVDADNNNMETLKTAGAPVDWKPLAPAYGHASASGVAT